MTSSHLPRAAVLALLLSAAPVLPIPVLAAPYGIVATVNGDVVTTGDVDSRTKLFVVSTGLRPTPEVMERLRPQITKQLIDERLRLQEIEKRKVVVGEKQIADTIADIEGRNGMQSGALRQKLVADGSSLSTLVNQIRAQIGWQQVLHLQLQQQTSVTDADIEAERRLEESQVGREEFRVAEIFIPIEDPSNPRDAQRFSEAVITQLRAGAPFPIVAAQFSQNQTALQGGELGWVQGNQLDPQLLAVVRQMPVGAISNPVHVPGGVSIVTLRGKRERGRETVTVLHIKQAFLPFTQPLNPQAPTDQQRQALARAKQVSDTTRSCDAMEQVAKSNPSGRPSDPGEVRLEGINPPTFRQLLASLPIGRASQPLVAGDGIALVSVCSRESRNLSSLEKPEMEQKLVNERVELTSRQLLRNLQRRADIQTHAAPVAVVDKSRAS